MAPSAQPASRQAVPEGSGGRGGRSRETGDQAPDEAVVSSVPTVTLSTGSLTGTPPGAATVPAGAELPTPLPVGLPGAAAQPVGQPVPADMLAVSAQSASQPTSRSASAQVAEPAGSGKDARPAPRELRFSPEVRERRSADTLQVPEVRRVRRARQTGREASADADTARDEDGPGTEASQSPRPSARRRGAGVVGRSAVLSVLAVATVVAPLSGYLTNAALASTRSSSQPDDSSQEATDRASSVAAAVLGSDADWDEDTDDQLSNVPDAATLARIREAYQNAVQTCSSETGASGDTAAFNATPELFYPMLPGSYEISSVYGYRIHPTLGVLKLHAGQDMAAPVGTAIYAAAEGTVTTAGMVDGTGTVTIKHEIDGEVWYTSYLHMYEDGIYVEEGDTVSAGDLIAGVGNTGRSSGAHLHFEVRTADDYSDDSTVDPWEWLEKHGAVELTTDCA
ncbi:M23 family metallopeptidase [Actinomyces lilanjuaniae]|uniref:M23 family metallopeptidase n=1 Tax=Actinomyces lilanjuaniae TaxID=2321394 RepID=UPI001FAA87A8|nr:M23 family metallopeptidase [Actinomyces lilanjuaniae]